MSKYIFRKLEVRATAKSRRLAEGIAIVDTAVPFTVVPRELAQGAKLQLGEIMPERLPVGSLRPYFRNAVARLTLEGGCSIDMVVRVPETPWHSDHGGRVLLGSDFLQPTRAKIDYGKRGPKPLLGHPVTCPPGRRNPPEFEFDALPEAFSHFESAPAPSTLPCPWCRKVVTVKAGVLGKHGRCPGSNLRVAT